MALIKSVRGFTPKMGKDCFLADNATIIGDVTMGNECSIWFNAVLRGDVNTITIGDRVNIQDGSVLHTLYQKSTIEIDNAEVGEGAIVAAGSVVTGKTKIGPNEMWAGAPAKFIKMVDPAQAKEINVKIAKNYLMYSKWYEQDDAAE